MFIPNSKSRSGFTLVELLVVIAIIGVLIALLLPAVQAAREAARRSSCINKMKQIGLALHNYHDTNNRFPAGSVLGNGQTQNCTLGGSNVRGAPWTVLILPYMELENLYDQGDITAEFVCSQLEGPNSGGNRNVWRTSVDAYQCPSFPVKSTLDNHSNYYGVMGGGTASMANCTSSNAGRAFYNNGILHLNSDHTFAAITDGSNNTFIVGENRYQLLENGRPDAHWLGWASTIRGGGSSVTGVLSAAVLPINVEDVNGDTHDTTFATSGTAPASGQGLHQRSFGSYHPTGCIFLRGDGSAAFVSETIDQATYYNLAIRNDGNVVTP